MKITSETSNIYKAHPLKGVYYTTNGEPTGWVETQMDAQIGKLLFDDKVAWSDSENPNTDFVNESFHFEVGDKLVSWVRDWLTANFPADAVFGICVIPSAWLKKFGDMSPIALTSDIIKKFHTADGFDIKIGENYYDGKGDPWNVRGFKPGSECNVIAADMEGNTKFDIDGSKLYYYKPQYTKDNYLINHSDRVYSADNGKEYIVTAIHHTKRQSALIDCVESNCDRVFKDHTFSPGQLVHRPPAADRNGKVLQVGHKVYWLEGRNNWSRDNPEWPYGKGKVITDMAWVDKEGETDSGYWEIAVELDYLVGGVVESRKFFIKPDKVVTKPTRDMIQYRYDYIVNKDISVCSITNRDKEELNEVFKMALNFNKDCKCQDSDKVEEEDEVTQKWNEFYEGQGLDDIIAEGDI